MGDMAASEALAMEVSEASDMVSEALEATEARGLLRLSLRLSLDTSEASAASVMVASVVSEASDMVSEATEATEARGPLRLSLRPSLDTSEASVASDMAASEALAM